MLLYPTLIVNKVNNRPIFSPSGAYDTLSVTFILRRNIGFYVFQYLLPCALIVILSWVGFWIDYQSTPARASLGITTVLTITTLSNSIRSSLPQVAYVKSLDIYLLSCFVFVFASTAEFALTGITARRWRKAYEMKQEAEKVSGFYRALINAGESENKVAWIEKGRKTPTLF